MTDAAEMTALRPLSRRPRAWDDVAAEQDGVIARRQARGCGMSEDQWQWRLDSGRWQSVLPGVAVTHTGQATQRQCAWAAVLYSGPGACLSGDAALVEAGMQLTPPRVLDVVVPTSRIVEPQVFRDGFPARRVALHRISRLNGWTHPVHSPPVLRTVPAVLHAASWASSDRAGEWRIAAAVQQRLVLARDLRAVLDEMPRLRRRGLVRTVLDDVELGAHAAGELDFLRFLRAHHLPPPDRLQRPWRTGSLRYLDAWWERQRVAVELDGAHHRSVGVWEQDALRANDVLVSRRDDRVLLLRFTNGNLRHDGVRVAAQLAAVLL